LWDGCDWHVLRQVRRSASPWSYYQRWWYSSLCF